MAKSGRFRGFLDLYTKIVWALVATVLLVGLLCASANMHCKKGGNWHCPKMEQKK